jgi:hypothetical protein
MRDSRSVTETRHRLTARALRPQSRLSLRAHLQLTVREVIQLTWPRAETPTGYISMATNSDLDVPTRTATQEMVDFPRS